MSDFFSGDHLGAENIRVVLRVRPFNETEKARGDKRVLKCLEDRRSVTLASQTMEDFGRGSVNATSKNFTFSACIDESADQQRFFDECGVKSLISKTLEGYSTTLFAYGQTGSGKTYSISGVEDLIVDDSYSGGDPREGVVPRVARSLFDQMPKFPQRSYSLRAACFEIYNEQVLDLLNPEAGHLQVRESKTQGFFVENLLVVECASVNDLMEVFKEGTRNRKVGQHAMNRDSSRSHSVLVLYLDGTIRDEASGEEVKQFGKLTFVDLAGSERLKYSGSSGEMLKETGSINRSLFTLGKVISTLDRGDAFVPYRDSKLTKLLMDSLGGSSLCIMVACCSPSSKFSEETLSTLQYASRAKNIKNSPVIQLDPQQRLIMALREEIEALRTENAMLRSGQGLPPAPPRTVGSPITGDQRSKKLHDVGESRSKKLVTSSADGLPGASGLGRVSSSSSFQMGNTGTSFASNDPDHPPFEKAVGYAAGYAAGLDQVREVLNSRGLSLGGSLSAYDLSDAEFGRRTPQKGSRLTPVQGSRSFSDSTTSAVSEQQQAENMRLKSQVQQLQKDRTGLEHRCKSWEEEARRVQAELDAHLASARNTQTARGSVNTDQARITQQAKMARMEAENSELKSRLGAQSSYFHATEAPIWNAPAPGASANGQNLQYPPARQQGMDSRRATGGAGYEQQQQHHQQQQQQQQQHQPQRSAPSIRALGLGPETLAGIGSGHLDSSSPRPLQSDARGADREGMPPGISALSRHASEPHHAGGTSHPHPPSLLRYPSQGDTSGGHAPGSARMPGVSPRVARDRQNGGYGGYASMNPISLGMEAAPP